MEGTQDLPGSRLNCSAVLEELSRSSAVVTMWKNGLVWQSLETREDIVAVVTGGKMALVF